MELWYGVAHVLDIVTSIRDSLPKIPDLHVSLSHSSASGLDELDRVRMNS